MHSDFCVSMTTKINLRRRMKNMTNCRKGKLSDKYAIY